MPKKKDKVITLRMNERTFAIVEAYAKAKGLSVSAYITSIVDSHAGWFIPLSSNPKVSIPKKVLFSLFSYASKDSLDELVKIWAVEQKHAVRLLYGELNLQSALDTVFKASKYLMGTDARIIHTNRSISDDVRDNNGKGQSVIVYNYNKISSDSSSINKANTFWVVIRHNLGENYSYFWNKMFLEFFALLGNSIDITTEYDETTISMRLKERK